MNNPNFIDNYSLFDRKAFSDYLSFFLKKQPIVIALIEIEDLDKWFAMYSPDIVFQSINRVLDIINSRMPIDARIFQISDSTHSIVFNKSKLSKIVDFSHMLRISISDQRSFACVDKPDLNICVGITKSRSKSIVPKAFSALKHAKKLLSKVYCLDISDSLFERQQHEKITLNAIIKNAVNSGKIIPFYQPIYDNKLKKVTKYECLSRLLSDDRILYPFDFLHTARQIGFMRSITYSVIDNSCKIFKDNDFDFSINITEEDIRDTNIIDYLNNRCLKYNIDPSRVIIELLEEIEFGDDNLVVNNVISLKNMGFKLAIDDFGYANSNFGRLIKMRIDYVKIDGRFINNMDTNLVSYKIVKSISNFAKTVNIRCIAEYVHSKPIQDLVDSFGIEFSQGYYIGQASSGLPN